MSQQIDNLLGDNDILGAISECIQKRQYNLGILLCRVYEPIAKGKEFKLLKEKLNQIIKSLENEGNIVLNSESVFDTENEPLLTPQEVAEATSDGKIIRVMLLANWADSKTCCNFYNKMTKGNYRWNNLELVWQEPCDYYVVLNCPPINVIPPPERTILFHMEPYMERNRMSWGDWAVPPKDILKFTGTHKNTYNNLDWHLNKTYTQLMTEPVVKKESVSTTLSTVLSKKYHDVGHIKRIDFVKYLDRKKFDVHVYGDNHFKWKKYCGTLPHLKKDDGMFPYKYVFNAENNEIRNYFTEKIVDGILAECLVFYWGCPNLEEYIDSRAFVRLELIDFEKDMAIIQQAISENWWEQRLPYIKQAKQKILNELGFMPRLERIINES